MTIAVAVQCSEGIVLAADSASSMATSEGITTRVWPHAKKVSHICDYNVGAISYGLGAIGDRNIQSLMYEFEIKRIEEKREDKVYQVEEVANSLFKFFSEVYEIVYHEKYDPDLRLGMIVAGYSTKSYDPEQYKFSIPNDPPTKIDVSHDRPAIIFDGLPDAIWRLLFGIDPKLIFALSQLSLSADQYQSLVKVLMQYNHSPDKVEKFVTDMTMAKDTFDRVQGWKELMQYDLDLAGIPLQDGIDLASWLIETTIGRYRFANPWPIVSEPIDMAVITNATFTWIQRKSWHGYNREPHVFSKIDEPGMGRSRAAEH